MKNFLTLRKIEEKNRNIKNWQKISLKVASRLHKFDAITFIVFSPIKIGS